MILAWHSLALQGGTRCPNALAKITRLCRRILGFGDLPSSNVCGWIDDQRPVFRSRTQARRRLGQFAFWFAATGHVYITFVPTHRRTCDCEAERVVLNALAKVTLPPDICAFGGCCHRLRRSRSTSMEVRECGLSG